ncbi:hypothetical protein JCM10449v2_002705 [Rhodotorula kratochvilovae]
MFSSSYATTHALEQQRLSSPAAAALRSPPVVDLGRAMRSIPDELRAIAPSSPYTVAGEPMQELPEEEDDEMAVDEEDPIKPTSPAQVHDVEHVEAASIEQEEDATLVDAPVEPEEPTAPLQQDKPRARSSLVGRMLFPARPAQPLTTSSGSPRSKRLSLPAATSRPSSVPLAKRASLPGPSAPRASLSSTSSARKPLAPLPSSSEGALPALPLAAQLASLKARNGTLAAALTEKDAQLSRLAAERAQGRTDAEGWEAEAQRLAAELAALQASGAGSGASEDAARVGALERELAIEKAKRRRAKELQAKLRCELVNRRWKEKLEVELLEREERAWEIKLVDAEAELAGVRYERDMDRAEKDELQELLALRNARISALSASRQLLLTSFRTAESTIASLRSDLSALLAEYDASLTGSSARIAELEEQVAEADELRAEVATLEKGGKRSEAEEKKAVEKERARREKAEGEVKELKAQLKSAQTALKASEKAASAAQSALEAAQRTSAAAAAAREVQHSSSTVRPGHRAAADPAEETEGSPAPPPKPKRAAKKVAPSPSPAPVHETEVEDSADEAAEMADEPEQEDEPEAAPKPAKSRARGAPATKAKAAKAPAAAKKAKKAASAPVDEDEHDGDDLPTPKKAAPAPVAASKKRKASVLGDKSANASTTSLVARASTAAGVHEGGGVPLKVRKGKKKAALAADSDDEAPADDEPKKKGKKAEDGEPVKKKKKIQLFGAPKQKFAWSLENANVNSLVPMDLSPIKLDPPKKKGSSLSLALSGLAGGGGARKSIFG